MQPLVRLTVCAASFIGGGVLLFCCGFDAWGAIASARHVLAPGTVFGLLAGAALVGLGVDLQPFNKSRPAKSGVLAHSVWASSALVQHHDVVELDP